MEMEVAVVVVSAWEYQRVAGQNFSAAAQRAYRRAGRLLCCGMLRTAALQERFQGHYSAREGSGKGRLWRAGRR